MQFEYCVSGSTFSVTLERSGDGWTARVGEHTYEVVLSRVDARRVCLLIDGHSLVLPWARTADGLELAWRGTGWKLTDPGAQSAGSGGAATGGDGRITTPMPGKVVRVVVQEGDTVAAGDTLLVLESMKMQNDIAADISGTVARIHHAEGDTVEFGDMLVEIEGAAS